MDVTHPVLKQSKACLRSRWVTAETPVAYCDLDSNDRLVKSMSSEMQMCFNW